MHTIGCKSDEEGSTCRFGYYHARDGSDGTTVGLDVSRPHAAVIVGKCGSGRFHMLGVAVKGPARATDVAPAVIDPMGAFCDLIESPISATVHNSLRVRADALPPSAWPELLGLDPTASAGSLV